MMASIRTHADTTIVENTMINQRSSFRATWFRRMNDTTRLDVVRL